MVFGRSLCNLIKFLHMYRYLKLLTIGGLCLSLCACDGSSSSENSQTAKEQVDFSKTLQGSVFFGVLPCGSCPGIETRVSLQENNQVKLEQLYQENDQFPTIIAGTYEIKGDILALSFTNKEDNQRYRIKSDTLITLLGEDDKEAEGETVALYNLTVVKAVAPEKVVGTYVQKSPENKLLAQFKVSYNQDKKQYSLSYNSVDQACKLQGTSVNSQAERVFFKLQNLQKGQLTLTFRDSTLAVNLEDAEKEDLQSLCEGYSANILGNYLKQNK